MSDALKRPIEPGLVARIARGVRYIVGGGRSQALGSPGENAADWFGPEEPLPPSAPPSVAGRSFDFPVGFNLRTTPRGDERLGFHELRALADNYDLLRLVKRALSVLTLPLWLANCATASSDTCPPVATYDRATEQRAAQDLATLPSDSPIVRMMQDYSVMRAQARLCKN
jgi:hypothetical protein